MEAPGDLQWLLDEHADVIPLLRRFLDAYLKLRDLPAANAAYKIATKLFPHEHELQQQYATFSISVGLVDEGHEVALRDMMAKVAEQRPDLDSYGLVRQGGLALLFNGLDAHYLAIARSWLLVRDLVEFEQMGFNCNHTLTNYFGRDYLHFSEVSQYLAACFRAQDVLQKLVDRGANVTNVAAHSFDFQPMHHAAAFGSLEIADMLMQLGARFVHAHESKK